MRNETVASKILLVLIVLTSCQHSNNKIESENSDCYEKYFYLAKEEYSHKNLEGNVLLHLSEEDSIFIIPEKVCTLHLYPDWERKGFPFEVLKFPNLKYLWVGMRDFKVLPSEIIQLKQLRSLNLQHSGVEKLTENIGELKNLEELSLLYSNLESLPQSICELPNLKKIHLGYTKIDKLPTCLYKLKNLEEFILFYEGDSEIPQELKLNIEKLRHQLKKCRFAINYNKKVD